MNLKDDTATTASSAHCTRELFLTCFMPKRYLIVHIAKGAYLGSGLWSKLNSDHHDYALCYESLESVKAQVKTECLHLFSFPEVEGESTKWPGYIHKSNITNYW